MRVSYSLESSLTGCDESPKPNSTAETYTSQPDSTGSGTETCIISYKKRIASLDSMQGAGCFGLVHWDDLEGWCVAGEVGGGSGLGIRVHLWRIHVDVWQNQYNIVKWKK